MAVHALPAPMRVHMMSPLSFNDAQEIGDRIKTGSPVFMDLRSADQHLVERLRDFVGGLTSALGGSVTDIAQGIVLVAPPGVAVSGAANSESGTESRDFAHHAPVTPLFRSLSA